MVKTNLLQPAGLCCSGLFLLSFWEEAPLGPRLLRQCSWKRKSGPWTFPTPETVLLQRGLFAGSRESSTHNGTGLGVGLSFSDCSELSWGAGGCRARSGRLVVCASRTYNLSWGRGGMLCPVVQGGQERIGGRREAPPVTSR